MQNFVHQSGRHFLQVPGPTLIPERILAAMCWQMLDHRSTQFQEFALRVLSGIRTIFRMKNPVVVFPSSGTGALEAALVKAFRFGHLGCTNATIVGALAAVEMGLELASVPHDAGGVDAALSYLTQENRGSLARKCDGSGNLFAQASI